MKKTILYILPLTLLTSCSSELLETTSDVAGCNVERVIIKSKPFEFDDDTRTSLTATGKGISFAWASYDALGVFPISPETNNQAEQKLNALDGADAHFATFDGAGWALNRKNTYAAYCPYNGKLPASTPYTAVPIDMTGQDGTLETIGKKYDYMYAPSSFVETTLSDGTPFEVVFDFKHAISIVRLKLIMPVAAKWKRVSLYGTTSDFFISSATMNVSTGEVAPLARKTSLNLNLNNVSTSVAGETITLYVAMLPTTTGELTVEAESSDNICYVAPLDSKTLVEGKAYRMTASLSPFVYPYDGYENGYAYVDLGLQSGLKWATMNVGAASPADNGNYYAWGETEPQSSNTYDWSSYKWCKGSYNTMTKYCDIPYAGTIDNKTTLEAKDDAARANWGGVWRMPTYVEQMELVNNCYWVWTSSYNGTAKIGYIVYKAKSSSDMGQVVTAGKTPLSSYSLSDSHIFISAAGICDDDSFEDAGMKGEYWSSSLNSGNNAKYLYFGVNSRGGVGYRQRCSGLSIRAVCDK